VQLEVHSFQFLRREYVVLVYASAASNAQSPRWVLFQSYLTSEILCLGTAGDLRLVDMVVFDIHLSYKREIHENAKQQPANILFLRKPL
jgi:hypothetical protein